MVLSSREIRTRLGRRARRADVPLTPTVAESLVAYIELLARWNRKINLTSLPLSEPTDETFDRLLIEPLIAAKYLPGAACSVIDIGSGGGSPAIPLKLAMPGITLRMVESKTRKAAFLREAIRHLKLTRVVVETSRFEELLSQPGLHEAHDVATLRAVRVETRVMTLVQAFLKPDGLAFLFRGASGDPAVPQTLTTFTLESTVPLIESLASRLVILKKTHFR
jgi:16S rRNA (guanine527-N7)-methyltransferase